MSFLRPEIKLWLYKWRECLISLVIAVLGLWIGLHGASKYNLILQFSGYIIAITGICIAIVAHRRLSFSQFHFYFFSHSQELENFHSKYIIVQLLGLGAYPILSGEN